MASNDVIERTHEVNGLNVRELTRPNGRVEHHVVAPSEYTELLLDLGFNNLESSLNKAQMNSYTMLIKKELGIKRDDFVYDGSFYRLRVDTETKFRADDVPIHLVPKEAQKLKVDQSLFLANELLSEEDKEQSFGNPFYSLNVRAGTFNSMADMLMLHDDVSDGTLSYEDKLLELLFHMQTKQRLIDEDMNYNKSDLKEALEPIAKELTSGYLSNTTAYFYPEDNTSKTSSRITMSKIRRFTESKAKKILKEQSAVDLEDVSKWKVDGHALRKEWPDLHKLGQSQYTSIVVEEADD